MDDIKVKKEIIDKIKSSSNILITVSNDPSVDELSAALGLTLALNKIEKYATAIFSGSTPPAISFLEPEKTFEENTDSLRDFIIALNREKADHLRFKPDGDYVKIFITPYRSIITPEDLEFSQGDFNVELVIALGVDNKEHLDDALDNHGQILHDATVASITAGDQASSLGSFNWHNPKASSISEMVTGLVEALKEDKKEPIIDGPIATALLTGIVAETERFSNAHTTSGVMTVAANLMNSGADQQLIAFKLEQSGDISGESTTSEDSSGEEGKSDDSDYTLSINRETKEATLVPKEDVPADAPSDTPEPEADVSGAYALDIPHEEAAPAEEAVTPEPEAAPEQPAEDPTPNREYVAEPAAGTAYALDDTAEPQTETTMLDSAPSVAPGSTAVSDVPAKEGLHSAYASDDGEQNEGEAAPEEAPLSRPIRSIEPISPDLQSPAPDPQLNPQPPVAPTLAPEPAMPSAPAPGDLGLPMPPPLPDFSVGAIPPPAIPITEPSQPEILGDILQPEPQPVAQPQPPQDVVQQPVQPPAPGQFQIPGQQ